MPRRLSDSISGGIGFGGGSREGFKTNGSDMPPGFTRITNEKINVKNNGNGNGNGNNGVKPMIACAVNFNTKQIKTAEGPTVRVNQLSRFEQDDWKKFFSEMTSS